MKITGVEPILAGKRYLFLRLTTDSGLIGYGECGAWGYQEATALVLRQMGKMIEGMDPMRIEFIYNALPAGQEMQYSRRNTENMDQMCLYSAGITVITSAVGVFFFRKKDIR